MKKKRLNRSGKRRRGGEECRRKWQSGDDDDGGGKRRQREALSLPVTVSRRLRAVNSTGAVVVITRLTELRYPLLSSSVAVRPHKLPILARRERKPAATPSLDHRRGRTDGRTRHQDRCQMLQQREIGVHACTRPARFVPCTTNPTAQPPMQSVSSISAKVENLLWMPFCLRSKSLLVPEEQ